jgi:hypothetical protein
MEKAGVPLIEIAAILGHKDTRMVERHYALYTPTIRASIALRSAPPLLRERQASM